MYQSNRNFKMPGGGGGGMLKLRFDWYIIDTLLKGCGREEEERPKENWWMVDVIDLVEQMTNQIFP